MIEIMNMPKEVLIKGIKKVIDTRCEAELGQVYANSKDGKVTKIVDTSLIAKDIYDYLILIPRIKKREELENELQEKLKGIKCKHCKMLEEKHYEEDGEKPYVKMVCKLFKRQMHLEDFCSYGMPKDNGVKK